MQSVPFSDVRAHLAKNLHEIEQGGQPVVISRRGKAAAVLMSMDAYQQMMGGPQGFVERLAQWRHTHLDVRDDEDVFADLRVPDSGRDFSW